LGFLLIDNLKVIWLPFLEPTFTAHVEAELEFIQNGQKNMDQVVEILRQEFLVLFDKFRQQKPAFLAKMQTLESIGNVSRGRNNEIIEVKNKAITTAFCPKCKKQHMELVISKNDKRFLVCQDKECKTFLSLPQKGFPKLLKTSCSLCGFDVVGISTKIGGKKSEYYLCPFCWTEGFKNNSGGGFCSKCPNFTINNKKCISKEKAIQKNVDKKKKEEAKKVNQ
jgi:ssDNA-binding Zn-finger/Zn-ribbon topoisomerase 1